MSAPRRVLAVLFFGVLIAALDIAIVGPALPALQDAFDVDRRTIAWVFNVFVLANLVSIPLMSRLADRFGRRTLFTADVLLFGLGATIVGSATSFPMLLVGRGVQGMAAAGIFPAASAVVGDTFAPEKHGRALGVLGAVYGVAFVIGPILAGIVLSVASWSWLFWLSAPLALLVAGLGWVVLPATAAPGDEPLDVSGMATIGVLLAALAYGVNQIDTQAVMASLLRPEVGLALLLAAALVPVFIRIERRVADPLLRLELFTSRQVQIASALAAGAGLTEAAFIFFPDLAVAAFGVADATASFMLLPLVIAVAIASPVAGRVLDRVGSRPIVLTGALLLAAGFAVMGAVPADRVAFYGGSIAIGFGLACLLGSSLSYILLRESSAAERTVAQGVIALFLGIGQLLGGAIIGAVAESGPSGVAGYAQAFLLIAGIAGGLALLATRLKGRAAEQEAAVAVGDSQPANDPASGPHERSKEENK